MALVVSASGDKLTTPSFVLPTSLTYAVWIKDNIFGASGNRIFENAGATTRFFFGGTKELRFQRLWTTTGEWIVDDAGLGTPDWTQWHHVAVTYDGSNVANVPKFYLDGVEKAITSTVSTPTGSLNATTQVMTIANRPSNSRPLGTLDHLGIYSAALSAADITSLQSTAHLATNQFANWSFDSLAATYMDLSGNGETATVAGAPTWTAGPTLGATNMIEATATFAVQALPQVVIPFGANVSVSMTASLTAEEGTPWPGGLTGGIGGPGRRRLAILRAARYWRR